MVLVVMGVSGCGKSTVGRLLAGRLGMPFYDADDFHPATNVEKMRRGVPLDDADRRPWLEDLARAVGAWESGGGAVLACSALRQAYRETLAGGAPGRVRFVWLDGSPEAIGARMRARKGHFMPPKLLESQFQALEKPSEALRIDLADLDEPVSEKAVDEVVRRLGHGQPFGWHPARRHGMVRADSTKGHGMQKADIGLIGLAVMGENLVLNMEGKGFAVAVFNRTVEKVDAFIAGRGAGKRFIGTHSIEELCASLERPRKVMMLVKAGKAVDDLIEQLAPHLEPGDIIIDGGNSHFPDTIRRTKQVEGKGLLFIGTGVSGGEEGALLGPSIMPGGSPAAWSAVKPIFQKICAQTDAGEPCCEWVGEDGAGHFVKMVHNGIEYGDMQMICETYQMMKEGLGLSNEEMHEVFAEWNASELDSYLVEITRDILGHKTEEGEAVIDQILDTAGQKGTGKWTAVSALDLGQPLTLIGEAVFARCLSALKDERVAASKVLSGPSAPFSGDREALIDDLKQALYASKIVSYAQGYQLMRAAAEEHGWKLNNGGIALMWRGGCIIRSVFLGKIKEAFDTNPGLVNLLLDPFFKGALENAQASWRRVVMKAVELGIPMPAIGAALAYYDGYRAARLPANLLQAQRDYFGAHTYERIDKPRGAFFHTNWTGRGGNTSASSYVA